MSAPTDVLELIRCARINCDSIQQLGMAGVAIVKLQLDEAIKALEEQQGPR